MASTNAQISKAQQDLVAIIDGTSLQPLFAEASPMSVTVREISQVMTSAIEDGSLVADHKVDLPTEIDLPLLLTTNTRNLYNSLRRAWKDGTILSMQTRVATFSNMLIYEIPHDEKAEMGQAVLMTIKMREVVTVKAEYGQLPARKVANKNQASTVKKGTQQTKEPDGATKRKASVLYKVVN